MPGEGPYIGGGSESGSASPDQFAPAADSEAARFTAGPRARGGAVGAMRRERGPLLLAALLIVVVSLMYFLPQAMVGSRLASGAGTGPGGRAGGGSSQVPGAALPPILGVGPGGSSLELSLGGSVPGGALLTTFFGEASAPGLPLGPLPAPGGNEPGGGGPGGGGPGGGGGSGGGGGGGGGHGGHHHHHHHGGWGGGGDGHHHHGWGTEHSEHHHSWGSHGHGCHHREGSGWGSHHHAGGGWGGHHDRGHGHGRHHGGWH